MNTKLMMALKRRQIECHVVVRRAYAPRRDSDSGEVVGAPGLAAKPDRSRVYVRFPRGRAYAKSVFGPRVSQLLRYYREDVWARRAVAGVLRDPAARGFCAILSCGGFSHMAALRCGGRLGIPIIANWNDPFPTIISPPPYGLGCDAPLIGQYRALLRAISGRAAWHTFASKRLRTYMLRYLQPFVEYNSSVVPHIARVPQLPPEPPTDNSRLILTHAGGLLPSRRVDGLLDGLRRFLAQNGAASRLHVRFIGPYNDLLRSAVQHYGITSICEFIDELRYDACQAYLTRSHVLVVVEADMPESVYLPSKLADYAETTRPILAISPAASVLHDLITEHGGGVFARCDSGEEVCSAVSRLYTAWLAGSLQAEYGSDVLLRVCSEATIVQQYLEFFERATGLSFPSRSRDEVGC